MKILVVDDERMIREVIKEYCAANQFTTDEAGSGKLNYKPNNGNSPVNNPFTKEHFNLTEQGKLFRTNPQQARAMAQAAGVTIGGIN